MIEEEEYYPKWLYEAIVEDFLPWEKAQTFTYEEFSEKYSLHDSIWIGLFANVTYEDTATLAIIWDASWLPDEIAESTPEIVKHPFLFIKVEKMEQIITRNYKDVNVNRGIAKSEFTKISGSKNSFIVYDHYGGEVEVIFCGQMKFLGIDREKKVLEI